MPLAVREVSIQVIEETAFNLLKLASIVLPRDVKEALRRAYETETSEMGKAQLEAILENLRVAEERQLPICQDTGVVSFYVRLGADFPVRKGIHEALVRATKRATKEVPLRPNAVDPIEERNTGDNTGRYIPFVHWEVFDGDYMELIAFPKGAGSENMCKLAMLSPAHRLKGLKKLVIDTVLEAGGKPCPPVILGVAFGGGLDIVAELAKRALLRPLDQPNPIPELAKLEEELLKAINETGIGPMGLGGRWTALRVHVDYACRHPGAYPVAIAFQCWAARRAAARINADGSVEYLTHEVG
ncbi:fumarate hydratase [Candidatus Bathyarchaeota archaeon]|nr:MAG: fumarate hydratase [Candidatus Bathyarchaeota archaeon]